MPKPKTMDLAVFLDVNLLYYWIRHGVTPALAQSVAGRETSIRVRHMGGRKVFSLFADLAAFDVPFDDWYQFPRVAGEVYTALKRPKDWAERKILDNDQLFLAGYAGDAVIPLLAERLVALYSEA
jgi:hypothetical protein